MDQELQKSFMQQDNRIDMAFKMLQELADTMEKAERKKSAEEVRAALKEIVADMHKSSVNYSNIIIFAGYAAFFAVWGTMLDTYPNPYIYLSGALMLISVVVFITFEIHKMYSTGSYIIDLNKAVSEIKVETPEELLQLFHDRRTGFIDSANQYWKPIFIATISTGFTAGFLLIAVLLYHMAKGLNGG